MTREIVRNEEGASAVEYGLLIAGIAAVIVAIVFIIGRQVDAGFTEVSEELPAVAAPAAAAPAVIL
ncbi:MAG: Flp family type IVb pilin [Actinomycetia bacterium]|nr:Flp family type IVb pilin [Actinomycetes bacterium]